MVDELHPKLCKSWIDVVDLLSQERSFNVQVGVAYVNDPDDFLEHMKKEYHVKSAGQFPLVTLIAPAISGPQRTDPADPYRGIIQVLVGPMNNKAAKSLLKKG